MNILEKIREVFQSKKITSQNNSVTIIANDGSTVNIGDVVGGDKSNTDILSIDRSSSCASAFDSSPIEIQLPTNDDENRFLGRIKNAEENQSRFKFYKAIDVYIEILSERPSENIQVLVFVNLAICYFNIKDVDDRYSIAHKYIEKAESVKSTLYLEKIHFVKSLYHFYQKEYELAELHIEKAISNKPNYIRAINLGALIKAEAGKDVVSIINKSYFDHEGRIKRDFSSDNMCLLTIGRLYLRINSFDLAIQYFEKALKIKPDDIISSCFLGDTYLFKALDGKIGEEISYSKENYDCLKIAIKYYDAAFLYSNNDLITDDIKPFIINYSVALLSLGKDIEAYEKIQRALSFGLDLDELYINKAKIELTLGKTIEAYSTLEKIPERMRYTGKAYLLLADGKIEECISYLQITLKCESLDNEVRVQCMEILADSYISKNQENLALEVLLKINRNQWDSWKTQILFSKYYKKIGEEDKSAYYLDSAIKESNMHPVCIVDATNILGLSEKYQDIIDLLKKVVEKDELYNDQYKRFVFFNLAKAQLYNNDYFDVINTFVLAKDHVVEEIKFYDILLECYQRVGNYSSAYEIAEKLHINNSANHNYLIALGVFSILLGQVESGIQYLKEAHSKTKKQDSSILMNIAKAYVLIDEYEEALNFATAAKELDKDLPASNAHSFFIQMNLRCGKTDSCFEYMMDYHACYPRQSIVRTMKSLVKGEDGKDQLSPEFLEFLNNNHEFFSNILATYKKNNIPLFFLSRQFNLPLNHIYHWRNSYKIKINMETGSPEDVYPNREKCLNEDRIIVDFLALLIFSRVDLLEAVFNNFKKIYISHFTFESIISSILHSSDPLVAHIWKAIRNNPKVILFTKDESGFFVERDMATYFGEELDDCLCYARNNKIFACIGDLIARNINQKAREITVGPQSIIDNIFHKKLITAYQFCLSKQTLMKENHMFISFSENELFYLASKNHYQVNDECSVYFKYLLIANNPDVNTFIKVYSCFFNHLFKQKLRETQIGDWIAEYIKTFNLWNKRNYLIDSKIIKSRN